MQAIEVISRYIDDTVRLLPRRLRVDVANELHSLLTEELATRAKESGRPADEKLALAIVREYGRPNEAAARYQPAWAIIDPADTTNFLRAAILGACSLALLSALRKLQPTLPENGDELVNIGILAWLGLLVVAFGFKGWMRRRWPASAPWKPRDRNRVNRVGAAVLIPFSTIVILFYAAPAWWLDLVSQGRINSSRVIYTSDFQEHRLPWILGLMVCRVVLLAIVAYQGRWRRLTRRIEIGLNMALAGLILSMAVDGAIFQSAEADRLIREVFALVAAIYIPGVAAMLYGELGRLDDAAKGGQDRHYLPTHSSANG